MRVTQTKRKCPHCGFVVTPEEIDRQDWYGQIGVLIVVCLVVFLCVTPAGTVTTLLYGVTGIIGVTVVGWVVYVILFQANVEKTAGAENSSDTTKAKFLSSPDFQLVRNFAQSELVFEDGAHEKLLRLLQNKGWSFTSEEIEGFVTEEQEAHLSAEQTIWITDQILAKNPQNREEYLRAYIDFSHPHENDYLHVLTKFLHVAEDEYPKLREELTSLSKNTDLDDFERRLRDGRGP